MTGSSSLLSRALPIKPTGPEVSPSIFRVEVAAHYSGVGKLSIAKDGEKSALKWL